MQVWQKGSQQADGRQIGADFIDEADAGQVGKPAEQSGPQTGHPEGQSEEETGDHADFPRQQFLGIDHDRRKGRCQHQADDDGEDGGPEQVGVGQKQREGQDAEDRNPNYILATDAVTDGPANERAHGDGGQKEEKMNLGGPYGDLEPADQVKDKVVVDARQVEVLGENQRHQDPDR